MSEPGERVQAWSQLHAALPPRLVCGQPSYQNERAEWVLNAFDPSERAVAGVRKREWQVIAPTEVEVVREMVRCRRDIAAGRVPK